MVGKDLADKPRDSVAGIGQLCRHETFEFPKALELFVSPVSRSLIGIGHGKDAMAKVT